MTSVMPRHPYIRYRREVGPRSRYTYLYSICVYGAGDDSKRVTRFSQLEPWNKKENARLGKRQALYMRLYFYSLYSVKWDTPAFSSLAQGYRS